jgi:hypothetical protein
MARRGYHRPEGIFPCGGGRIAVPLLILEEGAMASKSVRIRADSARFGMDPSVPEVVVGSFVTFQVERSPGSTRWGKVVLRNFHRLDGGDLDVLPSEVKFEFGVVTSQQVTFQADGLGSQTYCKFDVELSSDGADGIIIDPVIILKPGP